VTHPLVSLGVNTVPMYCYLINFDTNYIIFRNAEILNSIQFNSIGEGKLINPQEYYIFQNENFKIN